MYKLNKDLLQHIVAEALKEDFGDGDHTTLSTIPKHKQGKAKLVAKEEGIIAGIEVAEEVFHAVDAELKFTALTQDEKAIKVGDEIFHVEGSAASILSAERLALNFIQRMSGIATNAHNIVKETEGTPTQVLDTRKTTPNLRMLEKYAVKAGGAGNHRFGLFDLIMIKDNHIDFAGGIVEAIDSCRKYLVEKKKDLRIEVEVRTFEELDAVMKHGGVNRVMLDNFTPEMVQKALKIVDGKFETEASGGITIDNIRQYAETGVDFISVGALTHHIKSLDLSLVAI